MLSHYIHEHDSPLQLFLTGTQALNSSDPYLSHRPPVPLWVCPGLPQKQTTMWGEDSHVVCGQFGEANGQRSLLALCRHRLVISQGKRAAKCIG